MFIIILSLSRSVTAEEFDPVYLHARSFLKTNQWDSAVFYSKISLEKAYKDDDLSTKIYSYFLMAYSQNALADYGNAVINYLNAAELAEFSEDPKHKKTLISLYKNLSNLMTLYNSNDLVSTYITKALYFSYELKDTFQIIENTQNLISLLVSEKKYEEASEEIDKIFGLKDLYPKVQKLFTIQLGIIQHETHHYDEARKFYYKAIESWDENIPFDITNIASANLNIGYTYYEEGEIKKAEEAFLKTLPFCVSYKENNFLFETHRMLAKCYDSLGNAKEAMLHFNLAIAVMELPEVESDAYKIYNELSDFYLSQHQEHKALEFKDLYTSHLEKHIQNQKEILLLDKKYNMQLLTEKYFDTIKAKKLESQARKNTLLTVGICTSIFLLILGGLYYKQRSTKLSIIQSLNEIELNSEV